MNLEQNAGCIRSLILTVSIAGTVFAAGYIIRYFVALITG